MQDRLLQDQDQRLQDQRLSETAGAPTARVLIESRLFDPQYYLLHLPEAATSGMDPAEHFLRHGDRARRPPNFFFWPRWYAARHMSAEDDRGPFEHYLTIGEAAGHDPGPFFDLAWYRSRTDTEGYPHGALAHYLSRARGKGLSPNPFFDAELYLARNADVRSSDLDPFVHWYVWGLAEGRRASAAFDADHVRRTYLPDGSDENPFLAFMLRGRALGWRATASPTPAVTPVAMPTAPQEMEPGLEPVSAGTSSPVRPGLVARLNRAPPVSIVVPIHNAADDLERCLDALVRHTDTAEELILIDDCSSDPRIRAILAAAETMPNVRVFHTRTNQGFTGTVNAGMRLAGDNDVVLLNSDAIVTRGWLSSLRAAAYGDSRIGTVTPLSNNAGAFSVPEANVANAYPDGLGIDDVARLVRQAANASLPVVPTGNGFCLFIRRACLDAVGAFDAAAFPVGYGEENDFCMRALRAGFLHVIDDRTFVHHRGSASFGSQKQRNYAAGRAVIDRRYPEYKTLIGAFESGPELVAMRGRIRRALADAAGHLRPRPRIAFVLSTTTGGTPQTNADLMAALGDLYETWTIRCDAERIEVQRVGPAGAETVEVVSLAGRLGPAAHVSADYTDRITAILMRHGFELVHIRHLAWHGSDLPAVCRALGLPVVLSLHDFYLVCPTVKLLDETGRYCAGRCTPTPGNCTAELWLPAEMPPLKDRFVHRWREMFGPALRAADALVTTSDAARTVFQDVYPETRQMDFRVLPHGRSFERFAATARPPSAREKLKILVPGNISAAKGAALIEAILRIDLGRELEFHVLGNGGRLRERPGLVLHGRYEREAFADRAGAIGAHIGVVLSIWPETYCHTLTEMWAIGLPVLGLDCGAVGERIRAHGGGWLLPLAQTPADVMAALLAIRGDAAGYRERVAEVMEWQAGYGVAHDTAYMASRYDLLYRQILARRRRFAREGAFEPVRAVAVVGADAGRRRGLLASGAEAETVYWFLDGDGRALDERSVAYDGIVLDPTACPDDRAQALERLARERGVSFAVFPIGSAAPARLPV